MHSTFNIRRFIYASYSQKPLMSDIDQCARNLSCHANANCTDTIGSHLCTCHTGYTGDGQTCLGDFNKFPSMFRKVLYNQRGAILLLLFLYIQSQLFEAGSNLKRPFTQIMAPEVIKYLSLNVVLQNIQLWVVTLCARSPSDIDECSTLNICDKHASCSNTQGP